MILFVIVFALIIIAFVLKFKKMQFNIVSDLSDDEKELISKMPTGFVFYHDFRGYGIFNTLSGLKVTPPIYKREYLPVLASRFFIDEM